MQYIKTVIFIFLFAVKAAGMQIPVSDTYNDVGNRILAYADSEIEEDVIAYYRGRLSFFEKNYDRAELEFKEALTINGERARYHLWMAVALSKQLNDAGLFKKMGIVKNVKKAFGQAFVLDPANTEVAIGFLRANLIPGILGGNLDKAKAIANQVQNRDPVQGYRAWGLIHEYQKDIDKAEVTYLAASDSASHIPAVYQWLGVFYRSTNQYSKAAQVLENGIQKHPDQIELYFQLGLTHMEARQYDQAIVVFQNMLNLKLDQLDTPSSVDSEMSWEHLMNAKQYDQAFDLFEHFLIVKELKQKARFLIGVATVDMINLPQENPVDISDRERFLTSGESALKQYLLHLPAPNKTDRAWGHKKLGDIYRARDNKERARAEYRAALALDKKHSSARNALKRLGN